MQITSSPEMIAFFDKCLHNIESDQKNQFLGAYVTPQTEKKVIRELKKAGFAEFQKEPYPSLFLDTDAWEKTPYHQAISLSCIKDAHFRYEKEWVAGNELFNADCIQKDPERCLNDWMKLRAMDRDFQAVYLYQDDEDWMMDAPSEAFTNDPCAEKAQGKVLTLGLGIGYFLFMACRNPNVKEITVIEHSQPVIDMFNTYLLPQFPKHVPIHIIQSDAYKAWNKEYLDQFDYIYADIWQSSDDGLQAITKLLEQYEPPFDKTDFWIEDSCFEVMWTLSLLHFHELATKKKVQINPQLNTYMKKIQRYYAGINETVTDVKRLQFLMYDTRTIRHILAIK
ncbi:MAG: hypothetical protein SOI44_06555 [Lactimicrobium sp.]|jgi:hypothetical protein|uniref:hypothetical protein n=1 Tax=Lactimicrobium sp. TaxID=2563780 RepID=UPI002F355D2C